MNGSPTEGRMIGVRRRGCPPSVAARLEPRDELVEAQLLEPLADGLELGGAELDERAALAAQVQRLAQAGLPESRRAMIASSRALAAS